MAKLTPKKPRRVFGPEYWDEYGVLKLSPGFYLLLVLLSHGYWLWLMTAATMRPELDLLAVFYPDRDQFYQSLLTGVPALIVMLCISFRKPNGSTIAKRIFSTGYWLLGISLALQGWHWFSEAQLGFYQFDWPKAGQGLALFWALLYWLNSRYLRQLFHEWPMPESKKK